tara:strand:+ start:1315 stop:1605 length:291 start_codon:yes stop_codon:yes gene_type:complete
MKLTGRIDMNNQELHADFPNDSDWFALENFIPEQERGDYMLMSRAIGNNGQIISLYKHIDTRGYINLDSFGNTYNYNAVTNIYTIERRSNGQRNQD